MKRRHFLTAGTLGIASGAASTANAQSQQCVLHPNPATFVLVHGAWAGGFVYHHVASILRSRGHRVYTPTLSGLAERSHLLSLSIDLTTHVTDIVNVFRFNELDDAVLAGHSYGGVPVTGAADQLAERISSLVYLDALVPTNGQSVRDVRGEEAIPFGSEPPMSIPLSEAMAAGFGVPEAERWKYTDMPTGPLWQPLQLTALTMQFLRRRTSGRIGALSSRRSTMLVLETLRGRHMSSKRVTCSCSMRLSASRKFSKKRFSVEERPIVAALRRSR